METDSCGPCQFRAVETKSVKYCKTCQEALCKECADVHKSSRATRNHFLVGITDISVVSETGFAIENLQKCFNHPDKQLEFFCISHNHLICSTCVLLDSNRTCSNVIEIAKAGEALVQKHFIDKVQTDLQSVCLKFHRDKKLVLDQRNLTEKKQTGIQDWLNEVRSNVNTLFDKLEKAVLSKVRADVENENGALTFLLEEINENLNRMNDVNLVFESVRQNGSVSDIFRCILLVGNCLQQCQEKMNVSKSSVEICHHFLKLSNALHLLLAETVPIIEWCESRAQLSMSKFPELQTTFDEFLKLLDSRNKETVGTKDIPDSCVVNTGCEQCLAETHHDEQCYIETHLNQNNPPTTTHVINKQNTRDYCLSGNKTPHSQSLQTTIPSTTPVLPQIPQFIFRFPPPAHNVYPFFANNIPLFPPSVPPFPMQFQSKSGQSNTLANDTSDPFKTRSPEVSFGKPANVSNRAQSELEVNDSNATIDEQTHISHDVVDREDQVAGRSDPCAFEQKNKIQTLKRFSSETHTSIDNENKRDVESQMQKANIDNREDCDSFKYTRTSYSDKPNIELEAYILSNTDDYTQSASEQAIGDIQVHQCEVLQVEIKKGTSETETNNPDLNMVDCTDKMTRLHQTSERGPTPNDEMTQSTNDKADSILKECSEASEKTAEKECVDPSDFIERNKAVYKQVTNTSREGQHSDLSECMGCTQKQIEKDSKKICKHDGKDEKIFNIKPLSIVEVPWERKGRSEMISVLTLPDESVVVCDFSNTRFLSLNKQFQMQDQFQLQAKIVYIALLKQQHVAVCHKHRNRITLLETSPSFKEISHFGTMYSPMCAAAVDNDSMLVSMLDSNGKWYLHIISKKGKLIHKVQMKRKILDGYTCAIISSANFIFGYRILQCCKESDALYCFERDGREIFKYSVKSPNCITVHESGYIFLIDHYDQIHMVSSSGQKLLKYRNKCCTNVISIAITPQMNTVYLTRDNDRSITVLSVSNDIERGTEKVK